MNLQELRKQLDQIDGQMIKLLAERFKVTQKVGEYKRDKKINPVDPKREAEIEERIKKIAEENGLNTEFAHKFIRLVIDEVVLNHKKLQSK